LTVIAGVAWQSTIEQLMNCRKPLEMLARRQVLT
jgi:hypothetical protein